MFTATRIYSNACIDLLINLINVSIKMENSGTTFSQKKDNNYGRNVVILNIKVDL